MRGGAGFKSDGPSLAGKDLASVRMAAQQAAETQKVGAHTRGSGRGQCTGQFRACLEVGRQGLGLGAGAGLGSRWR